MVRQGLATSARRLPAHRLALGLVAAFVTLASTYSVSTPLWEAPDEVGHFNYVMHLLKERSLPLQRPGEPGEAHQPPLYYLLAAIAAAPADLHDPAGAFKPNPNFQWAEAGGNEVNISFHTSEETFPFRGQALALHLARGVSVLMAAGTVLLVLKIGASVFPTRPSIWLLAAALVALNPQFLFASGAVSNDNLLTLGATGACWQLLQALKRPAQARQWVYVGLWIGVAVSAELSGFLVALVAGLVLLACAVKGRSFALFLRGAAGLALAPFLLTGWWFFYNQARYGDSLGWSAYSQVFAGDVREIPFHWIELKDFFRVQFRSFWGVFGWMNVSAPGWYYVLFLVLVGAGLLGLVHFFVRGRWRALDGHQKAALALLGLAIVAQEAFMIWAITGYNASLYQGRYLFPVIGPLMILVSVGLANLLPRRQVRLAAALALLLVGIAAWVPFGVIRPAYRIVPLPKWSLWFVPNRTEFTFGDWFQLQGYDLQVEGDGSQASLTLYWQALQRPDWDYSVFVHLIDRSDQLVAQKDHAPGESRSYPPTRWWPGDIVADEHRLDLPPQFAPGKYRYRVGVYNWATGEQLPVRSEGEPRGTFVVLDQTVRR